ncbi:MAG TPA: DUF2844 domain-containing protein [Steroidobacteraceae bacterium]|nr:DUF2844 domain-containing protein [Steroidobacteraceae bacterium]
MQARALVALIGLAGLAQAASPLAHAALGGDAASIQDDGARMKGQVRTAIPAGGYSVEEVTIPSGTVVREYISRTGRVFAVSWRGPSKPDLRQTLGAYYDQFVTGARAPHLGGHRHLLVRQADLVVESNGRAHAFFGRAYVPSLLPANFAVDEIQ